MDSPRCEPLMTQLSNTMLRKSSQLSVPILIAAEVEISVQLLTVTFSTGPKSAKAGLFFRQIQSSPAWT